MSGHVVRGIKLLEPGKMSGLLQESESEGFGFIRRLVDDYVSGANRFAASGEALYGAYYPGLVGICGLNRDPYLSDPNVGRVRHLYVLRSYRRAGVGRSLVGTVIADARSHFRLLVLRTTNPEADKFYRALGFSAEPRLEQATHYLDLSGADGERGERAGNDAAPRGAEQQRDRYETQPNHSRKHPTGQSTSRIV